MPVQEATELIELTHAQLIPPSDNVRAQLVDIAGLADTIFEHGLLQPLLVSMPDGAKKATIVAGARRHAAIGMLIEQGRLKRNYKITCVRRGELDDESRVVAMLVENLQRADLNPIEEARGYQRLNDEFKFSRARIAEVTGRSKTAVQVRLALLKLAPSVQEAVASRDFALDLASRLAVLPADVQEKLVARHGLAGLHAYRIDEAEREVERQRIADTFHKACEVRGLTPTLKPAWQLTQGGFATVATVALKDLPGALLPDDLEGAVAQLDYAARQVTVWMPRDDAPAGDALEEWRAECDQIRTAHAQAVKLWREQADALAGPWIRKVPAKMIHEAALRYTLHDGWISSPPDLEATARAAGFERPGIVSADEAADLLDEWLDQPSNLLATSGLMLLKKEPGGSLARLFDEHVVAEIGAKPEHPPIPDRPGTGHFTDDPDVDDGPDDDPEPVDADDPDTPADADTQPVDVE